MPVIKGSASKKLINPRYLRSDTEDKHQDEERERATQEEAKDEDLEENKPAKCAATAVLKHNLTHGVEGLVQDLDNPHGDEDALGCPRP